MRVMIVNNFITGGTMLAQTERDYITVLEAAERAGLSEPTIRRIIAAGFLQYRGKRQRTLLLDGNELDAGLAAYRAEQTKVQPFESRRTLHEQ